MCEVAVDLRVAYFFCETEERTILTYDAHLFSDVTYLSVLLSKRIVTTRRDYGSLSQAFLRAICEVRWERSIRLKVSIKRIEYAHSLSYHAKTRTIEPLVPVDSPS